ncbi:hypothetical protein Tco_0385522 [Tanacetum coccineum]
MEIVRGSSGFLSSVIVKECVAREIEIWCWLWSGSLEDSYSVVSVFFLVRRAGVRARVVRSVGFSESEQRVWLCIVSGWQRSLLEVVVSIVLAVCFSVRESVVLVLGMVAVAIRVRISLCECRVEVTFVIVGSVAYSSFVDVAFGGVVIEESKVAFLSFTLVMVVLLCSVKVRSSGGFSAILGLEPTSVSGFVCSLAEELLSCCSFVSCSHGGCRRVVLRASVRRMVVVVLMLCFPGSEFRKRGCRLICVWMLEVDVAHLLGVVFGDIIIGLFTIVDWCSHLVDCMLYYAGSVEGCSTARLQLCLLSMGPFFILDKLGEVAESPRLLDKMRVVFTQARKEEASFATLMRELCCSLRVSLSKKRRLAVELEGHEKQGNEVRAFENMKEIVAHDFVMLGLLEQLLARAQVGWILRMAIWLMWKRRCRFLSGFLISLWSIA